MKTLFCIYFLAISLFAHAQIPGTIDPDFETGWLAGGHLNRIKILPDSSILAAGYLRTFNDMAVQNFVKLNSDLTVDETFVANMGTAFSGDDIQDIAVQSDGKILVAGDFYAFNGIEKYDIVRLHADGTLDESFNAAVNAESSVINSVVVQEDGKIMIAGDFISVNGTDRSCVARLLEDGSVDPGFTTGTGFNSESDYVTQIAQDADGNYLLIGYFDSYDGNPLAEENMLRLHADGSFDASFAVSGFTTFYPYAVRALEDGKMYVGGTLNDSPPDYGDGIFRLNYDGSIDYSFNVELSFEAFSVYDILPVDDAVYISGRISYFDDMENGIIRLNSDGTIDPAFYTGYGILNTSALVSITKSIDIFPDGRVLIAGAFNQVDHHAYNCIARLYADGSPDLFNTHHAGHSEICNILTEFPDGGYLVSSGSVAGSFDNIEPLQTGLVKINYNGSVDTFYSEFLTGDSVLTPGKVVRDSVEEVYMLGYSNLELGTYHDLAWMHLDYAGNLLSYTIPGYISGVYYDYVLQPDGKLIVCGWISEYNGDAVPFIMRLNSDATLDTEFMSNIGDGPSGGLGNYTYLSALLIQSDGKIIVAGNFDEWNGSVIEDMVRLNTDGSPDVTFNAGAGYYTDIFGYDPIITSMQITADNKILVAGKFNNWAGSYKGGIVRLLPDGSPDLSFDIGNASNLYINKIEQQSDGKIILMGTFDAFNGYTGLEGIVRLEPDGSMDESFLHPNPYTSTEAIQHSLSGILRADGHLILAGNFYYFADKTCDHITGLFSGGETCPKPEHLHIEMVPGPYAICTWDAASASVAYEISYRPADSLVWLRDTVTALTDTIVLEPSVTYQFMLRSLCDEYVSYYQLEDSLLISSDSVIVQDTTIFVNDVIADINNLYVYPNPNNGNFTIELNGFNGDAEVKVYDVQGRLIYNENFYAESEKDFTHAIHLEDHKGIFFIKISDAKQQGVTSVLIE